LYVERLTIENFKCFERAELELNYPGRVATPERPVPERLPNVNLFLGDNGSGKSSVFKALAIGVLAPVLRASVGFNAEFLVRRQRGATDQDQLATEATLTAEVLLSKHDIFPAPDETLLQAVTLKRDGDLEEFTSEYNGDVISRLLSFGNSPQLFVAGYGASRRTERPTGYSEGNRHARYRRVAGLFEEHVGLVPFTLGYLQLQNLGYFEEAQAILNDILPNDVFLTARLDSQQRPLFSACEVLLPFDALSDGYRTFVGWVWDLLFQMAILRGRPEKDPSLPDGFPFTVAHGLVIVDEIDLFLHPEWQRQVVAAVARAFPKLQFCFSTHSPLVAGTLEPSNIFVLETAPDGTATVEQYREDIYGLTANQVLTSSYFGLDSTRAPNTGTLADLASRMAANGAKHSSEAGKAALAEAKARVSAGMNALLASGDDDAPGTSAEEAGAEGRG
jgi:energy-coupling factor transporter ATP-binding protein EcfA2